MSLILGTNSIKDTGYNVDNSLRFNDGSSDYLAFTPSSETQRKIATFSAWVKRGLVDGGTPTIFEIYETNSNHVEIFFDSSERLNVSNRISNTGHNLVTNAVYRDPSAWMHIVYALDTTQGTQSNRQKLYVNGTQIDSFAEAIYMGQNTNSVFGTTNVHHVGRSQYSFDYFDGYIAELAVIDGTALDPTSFGEFDSDSPTIWKPKDFKDDVTFGNNGFYLDFENSGSLGADVSGNSNNFTVNNLTSIDQSTDTCTNNFCTWNSIADNLDVTLSEGNLKVVHGTQLERRPVISTFGVSRGKWFWEWKNLTSSTPGNIEVGIVNYASPFSQGRYLGQGLQGDADFTTYIGDGSINMSGTVSASGTTYTTETISVAVDMDNTLIYFYKNGSLVNSGGTNFSGMEDGSGFIFMANADRSGGSSYTASVNFGNPPYSESGGNSDGNGYGNFSMAVPSGFYSLCTKNLAEYG